MKFRKPGKVGAAVSVVAALTSLITGSPSKAMTKSVQQHARGTHTEKRAAVERRNNNPFSGGSSSSRNGSR